MSIFEELKRRNVFRVAAAYLVVAWLILQVTDTVGSMLELPATVGRGVLLVLTIGFFVTSLFSWIYEFTPDGLKLEKDVDRSQSITQATGRKIDRAIIGVLTIALAFFAFDKFFWTGSGPLPESSNEPVKIAVLPFTNLSDDANQEYFSDGLSEELLNLLSRIPNLHVTSRTSAFSFKGKDFTMAEVGEQLGVAHVLEGSVRRSGNTLRITAKLIEVATDTHVWADSWNREFDDIFVIQVEIAGHVVDALKLQLLGDFPTIEETAPEVYAMVLEGSYLTRQGHADAFRAAIALLERAIEIDPEYSKAWSMLGWAHYGSSSRGVSEKDDVVPIVQEAIDTALRLNPADVDAYMLRAQVAWSNDYDLDRAFRSNEIAAELEPWNARVQTQAASWAWGTGRIHDAVLHLERAHELDPLAGHRERSAPTYYFAGEVDRALQYLAKRAEESPKGDRRFSEWARIVLLEGSPDEALALLEREASDGHQATGRALVYQWMGDTQSAQKYLDELLALGSRWTFEIAEVYAYMGAADEAIAWLHRAIDRRDSSLNAIIMSPFLDPVRDDPRFNEVLERLDRNRTF